MVDQLCRKYGQAPYKLVLVHGGPGAVGEMGVVAQELSSVFGVVETLHRTNTIANQIEELRIVIEQETTPPVNLIGFSWGAWLSILFTSKFKKYVKKLILIGCGPLETKYAAEIYTTRLSRLNIAEQRQFRILLESFTNKNIRDLQAAFNELSILIYKTDTYDSFQFKDDNIELQPEVFLSVWKEAEVLRKECVLLKAVKKIDLPIFVIHGDYDPHPANGIIKPLQQYSRNFDYEILRQCGHKPWIEMHARSRFYDLLRKIIFE
jgi:pimeloyl-ACP methyl ester carboxylesterase